MNPTAISVQKVGKKYRIRHQQQERYTALRDVIARKLSAPFRRLLSGSQSAIRIPHSAINNGSTATEDFWALQDVSFEVEQGEAVGIIGRNGAGKSTLLKILSRITEPTRGEIKIRGRVGSLLEVGTGFHPELSGRENIYLNGAVLGMKRAEILKKFDEIVAFAEVEKFLDTPVKHYSSGMYVRLAFAVAAHLEPDILIVDEVLAVGDADFQSKCLGKMDSVARNEGRTVLFVSHDLLAIQRLTTKSLLLAGGRVAFWGSTQEAVQFYTQQAKRARAAVYDLEKAARPVKGSGAAVLVRLSFAELSPVFAFGDDIAFTATVRAQKDLTAVRFSITVVTVENNAVGSVFAADSIDLKAGETADVQVNLRKPQLAPGQYSLRVGINRGGWPDPFVLHDVVFDVLHFEISAPDAPGGGLGKWHPSWGGMVLPELSNEKVAGQRRCATALS